MESEFAEIERQVGEVLLRHRGQSLRNTEKIVLLGSLQGLSYKQMGATYHHPETTLKQTGYELWQELSVALGGTVNKRNCQHTLVLLLQKKATDLPRSNPEDGSGEPPARPATPVSDSQDSPSLRPWQAPTLTSNPCLGRSSDLNRLIDHIQGPSRLIIIGGPVGIGKTTLVRHLLEQLGEIFPRPIQMRAEDVRTLQALLHRLDCDMAQENGAPPRSVPTLDKAETSRRLMRHLQTDRLLLVIENAEVLCRENEFAGRFQAESQDYEYWLERVAEDNHRSCVLWVGRQMPHGFSIQRYGVYHHCLQGLPEDDARELWQSTAAPLLPEGDWQTVYRLTGGNPHVLLIAADLLRRSHGHLLIACETHLQPLPSALQSLWEKDIRRWSAVERTLMFCLVIQPLAYRSRGYLTHRDISPNQLDYAWESLVCRGLLMEGGTQRRFRLHPPILQQVAAHLLVETCFQEIQTLAPEELHHHPLLQVTAPVWQQAQQRRDLLIPLANKMRWAYPEDRLLLNHLQTLLHRLRDQEADPASYAVGNLLNLAGVLRLSLASLDFSGLAVRQADLRTLPLVGGDGRQCGFRETRFPEGLCFRCRGVLSRDGGWLAIGDTQGRIFQWRRQGDICSLIGFEHLPQGITALAYGSYNQELVIAAGPSLYVWSSGQERIVPAPLLTAEAEISSLCIHPDGEGSGVWLALGMADGRLAVVEDWDDDRLKPWSGHSDGVVSLAFGEEGRTLTSCGSDNQLRCWSQAVGGDRWRLVGQPWESRSTGFLGIAWWGQRLQAVEVDGGRDRTYLHTDLHQFPKRHLLMEQGLRAAGFSPNGRYLAGSLADNRVLVWDVGVADRAMPTPMGQVSDLGNVPVELSLSDDGHWLFISTGDHCQLFDVQTGRCYWETQTVGEPLLWQDLNLQGASASHDPHINWDLMQRVLQDLGISI